MKGSASGGGGGRGRGEVSLNIEMLAAVYTGNSAMRILNTYVHHQIANTSQCRSLLHVTVIANFGRQTQRSAAQRLSDE